MCSIHTAQPDAAMLSHRGAPGGVNWALRAHRYLADYIESRYTDDMIALRLSYTTLCRFWNSTPTDLLVTET